MTTPTGPLCDFCAAEPAIMSMMNMGTYDQQLIGQDCAPAFLLGLLRLFPAPDAAPDAAPNGDGPAQDAAPAEPPAASTEPPGGTPAPLPKRQPRARGGAT